MAAVGQVEMEVVAVQLVGLGAEHRAEHAAGALVQPAQEVRLRALLAVLALGAARSPEWPWGPR